MKNRHGGSAERRWESFPVRLNRYASDFPQDTAIVFLADGETPSERLVYDRLDRRCRDLAMRIQTLGGRGQRVLLQLPQGVDFIVAFLGCLYAGAVAVPAPVGLASRALQRTARIVADCQPALVLTDHAFLAAHGATMKANPAFGGLLWVDVGEGSGEDPDRWLAPELDPDDLAFLQYTSGSTSTPKGVCVSHGNLMHNMGLLAHGHNNSATTPLVSWLPFFHDMGLMAGMLQALYCGAPAVLMPPLRFLQKPIRWLRAISEYCGHTSGAPNFAYDLCVQRTDPAERAGLDLSCWKTAFNGAEPISARTLVTFSEAFAPYGFRADFHYPNYGLAEATLIVSGGEPGAFPVVRRFDVGALAVGNAVVLDTGGNGRELVSSGRSLEDGGIRIVDPQTHEDCGDDRVGEIWIHNDSVAQGYWRREEENRETFAAHRVGDGQTRFLRTGDLGFLCAGELFVTGRRKDLIVYHGRNVYPSDIESAAMDCLDTATAAAAFLLDPDDDTRVALVQALRKTAEPEILEEMAERVRQAVWESEEIPLTRLVFVKPSGIQKTTSGKLMRSAIRAALLAGELAEFHRVDWSQAREASASPAPETSPGDDLLAALLDLVATTYGLERGRLHGGQRGHELGLDSLDAVRLTARVEARFGVQLPVSFFLEDHTLAVAADTLRAHGAVLRDPPAAVAVDSPQWKLVPLNRGQEALYIAHHLNPDSGIYNVNLGLEWPTGEVLPEALQDALDRLADRHPMLRAQLVGAQDEPWLHFADHGPRLRVQDRRDEWDRPPTGELAAQGREPFALFGEGLSRATLILGQHHSVLLLTLHHLICDGWSVRLLFEEIAATLHGQPLAQAQGSDPVGFLGLQEGRLSGAFAQRAELFWRELLRSPPEPLYLPGHRAGVSTRGNGDSVVFTLDAKTEERLRLAASRGQGTAFLLLLTAFNVVLFRYTQRRDLITAAVAALGRGGEFDDAVSYQVNPITLRTAIDPAQSVADYRQALRRRVEQALAYADFPYQRVLPLLAADRHGNARSYPQVAFGFLRWGGSASQPRWAWPRPVLLPQQEGAFGISLQVYDMEGRVEAHLGFDARQYERTDMERLAAHFQELLRASLESPQTTLGQLPMCDEPESRWLRQQLLGAPAKVEEGAPDTVWCWFERQVRERGDHPAVVDAEAELNYRELHGWVSRIAGFLHQHGVGEGQRVGVVARREWRFLATCLAIWRLRAAYVPLVPELPPSRIASMTAGLRLVIQVGEVGLAVPPECPLLTCAEAEASMPLTEALPAPRPDDVAYVIYTSGSSGRPKGVPISQGALLLRLLWKRDVLGLDERQRVLCSVALGFDPSVWELFLPMVVGGTVVMGPAAGAWDPDALLEIVRSQYVTAMTCIPPQLAHLADHPKLPDCTSLADVMTGGEALSVAVARRFMQRSGARVHHFYGPTEATIYCTYHACDPDDAGDTFPIGRPISATRLRVLDEQGQAVPVGVPGELYIGGEALAEGYLDDPERTRRSFVPDPLGGDSGGRLYRSGDRVVMREDGELRFLGRRDAQVKLRGYRIELEEIDLALRALPGVEDAAVAMQHGGDDRDRLVAFLVGESVNPGSPNPPPQLRVMLPDYMIPAVFVFVDRLPMTPAGKLDRDALPFPEYPRISVESGPSVPGKEETQTESVLLSMWRELLGAVELTPNTDFFQAGGHSLLVLTLLERIERRFGARLPAASLYEAPTLEAFALRLDAALLGKEVSAARQEGPVLFCIAPGLGDEASLAALNARLGKRHRLHTILPPVRDAEVPGTLAELARYCADVVEREQPDGPYFLGGFSIAGIVALEAARELGRRGHQVANVVMFDTILPPLPTAWIYFLGRSLINRLPGALRSRLPVWVTQAMEDAGLYYHVRVCRGYRPTSFDGPATLIISQANVWLRGPLFGWWRRALPALREARPVSGWHQTIFHGDGLGELASRVREAMAEQAGGGGRERRKRDRTAVVEG